MKLLLIFTLTFLSLSCTVATDNEESQRLKVLIVDGQNNHTVWPKATVMMKSYLEESGLFDVEVYRTELIWRGEPEINYLKIHNTPTSRLVDEPATDDSFLPKFQNYDVVVSNFGYKAASWPVATQKAFEDYMKNGGAFVSVHAANNTFADWNAYNQMTGLGGWGGRTEKHGPYVYFDEQGKLIKDTTPGDAGAHGNKHEFQITKRNQHPIMDGLPDVWMHAKDECYGRLRGLAVNMTVLASALCPKEEKGTGLHEPMLMTINYGKGRIFHTTLGHQQESYESVGFITTFLRGTEWAATGKVTQTVPSDFPTKNKSSKRPFKDLERDSKVAQAETKKPPNILLILSDDHAWNDYGFMGHEIVKTPSLDKLAAEGVTYKRGYVPTSLCRPSLATIATGLYASQHGITGNDPSRELPGGKTGKEYQQQRAEIIAKIDQLTTLPQLLKSKGYVSLQTGKWWEGNFSRGGFDHGMTRGFPEKGGRHGDDGLKIGREGLSTITDFIDETSEAEKPFFVWYAPYLPHAPHNPPERLLEKYKDKDLPISIAKYYAMIEWFDETNGQLIDHLEQKGLKENTLIVYVSDNGWVSNPTMTGRFLPRSKQSPGESGVRTPIIFSLPNQFKAQMRPELVSSIDIVPTILGAAGINVPTELPGENLYENMKEQRPIQRDTIFGEGFAHDMADLNDPESTLMYRWVIENEWKLILSYDGKNVSYQDYHKDVLSGPRLYNLVEDEHEVNNLAERHPDIVKRLSGKLNQWYPVNSRKVLKM